MKNFKITIYDREEKKTVLSKNEFSKTKKYLQAKYRNEYFSTSNKYKITISRQVKKPGIQTDLISMIAEIEKNV